MGLAAPIKAMDAVAVSSTTTYVSAAIPAMNIYAASVQVITAGSNPNGALKVQFSNDFPQAGVPGPTAPTNWSDLGSATVSTTNNGVYKIDRFDVCATWIRLSYTNASGSGTVSANVKTIGY